MPFKNRIACFVLLLIFIMSFGTVLASAQEDCSITVLLEDKEKRSILYVKSPIWEAKDISLPKNLLCRVYLFRV